MVLGSVVAAVVLLLALMVLAKKRGNPFLARCP